MWGLVHNCLAHPLLGLMPCRWTERFHEWTAEKMGVAGLELEDVIGIGPPAREPPPWFYSAALNAYDAEPSKENLEIIREMWQRGPDA